jgi:hypothetical protein
MGHLPLTSLPSPHLAPPRSAQREAAQGLIEMIEEVGTEHNKGESSVPQSSCHCSCSILVQN